MNRTGKPEQQRVLTLQAALDDIDANGGKNIEKLPKDWQDDLHSAHEKQVRRAQRRRRLLESLVFWMVVTSIGTSPLWLRWLTDDDFVASPLFTYTQFGMAALFVAVSLLTAPWRVYPGLWKDDQLDAQSDSSAAREPHKLH